MPSADRLQEFIAIVDCGSISAAARKLELPRATLSRRLSDLEVELGATLLHRETRRLVLTDAGRRLLERGRSIVDEIGQAWQAVQGCSETPQGSLRLALPAEPIFYDMLCAFSARFPLVELQVLTVPARQRIDLNAESAEVAIRIGATPVPGRVTRSLRSVNATVVASKAYLERHGRPASPEQLAEHNCIVFIDDEGRPDRRWPLRGGGTVEVGGNLAISQVGAQLWAATGGIGLALLPDDASESFRLNGMLEPILPETIGFGMECSLEYRRQNLYPATLTAFVEFATAFYRRRPRPRLVPPKRLARAGGA